MDWARILAYVTGTVDQELLARNEYLTAENRIIKAQLKGRLKLSDAERGALGEIGHRLVEKSRGRPGRCRRRTVTWCRRAMSSSSSEARLRTRNESREPTTDRRAIMSTTVWKWYKKHYTCSAFSTFEQAQDIRHVRA